MHPRSARSRGDHQPGRPGPVGEAPDRARPLQGALTAALLDLADELSGADVGPSLGRALRRIGPASLPLARRWIAVGHQLVWSAFRVVAEHGDSADVTVLIAALDWLDGRAEWCGYDPLVKGLVRIGGPVAVAAVPRIRRLWFTPHSYERACYLHALLALDPDGVTGMLVEGLTDCEEAVRMLAAQRVPLTPFSRRKLSYLRDDSLEVPAVRAAAADRLS